MTRRGGAATVANEENGNAALAGIHKWDPSIRAFTAKYPQYAYLNGLNATVEVYDGAPKRAGYDGIEINTLDDPADRKRFVALAQEVGLELPSVMHTALWQKPLSSPDETTRQDGLENLRATIDTGPRSAARRPFAPGFARRGRRIVAFAELESVDARRTGGGIG